MTRAENNAQMERMAETYARFDRLVSEHLSDYKESIARPCPSCGQMLYPGESCPVCRRGKK